MMQRIHDGELKAMELVWEHEPVSAKELSVMAREQIGWSKNTTYTILTRLVEKGYLRREDPGFLCTSLVSAGEIRRMETQNLINRLFDGSRKALFSALLTDENLSRGELDELRRMIESR